MSSAMGSRLAGRPTSGTDLSRADLSRAWLYEAELSGANLSDATPIFIQNGHEGREDPRSASSRQPTRIGDCVPAGSAATYAGRRLETLIGASPFLIRPIEKVVMDSGYGLDDGRRPRRTEGGGSDARISGPGCGQADRAGGPGAPRGGV